MPTFSNAYIVFNCAFYPTTPTANTIQSKIRIAALSQAAAIAALTALFSSVVVVSITPDTDSAGDVSLPAAVTGTTSPGQFYSVDFYPSAPGGATGTAGASSYQSKEAGGVKAQNLQVVANTPAQAIAVVVNFFPNAVIIGVGPATEASPTVAVQLT